MICYNKGPALPEHCNNKCKVIKLNNVGRESHTYLHHIIANYDNLAKVTLFIPGSWMLDHKRERTYSTLRHVLESRNSVFEGYIDVDGALLKKMYDFQIDEWRSTDANNKAVNSENSLVKSPIRPFGKWYEYNFGNTDLRVICWYGIFAVSREHILQHPRGYYERLMSQVDSNSNPEIGHYMERSWASVFYPYPKSCVYNFTGL
jgi:hypothetical protein